MIILGLILPMLIWRVIRNKVNDNTHCPLVNCVDKSLKIFEVAEMLVDLKDKLIAALDLKQI